MHGMLASLNKSCVSMERTCVAGAGSACEGEDWIGATKLPQLSVGVTHVYWRQTEVRVRAAGAVVARSGEGRRGEGITPNGNELTVC